MWIIIGLLLVGNIFTALLQDYFIFRFAPLSENHAFVKNPVMEEVTLSQANGKLHGIFFSHPNAKGVVLFFHGNRGNVERWKEVVDRFTSRGYAVFIPDYRGYGKSTGPRSESNFYADALACHQWLMQRFREDQIVIYGRSIGSAAATYVAAKAQSKKLILETPFYSMKDLFYTYYPFLPPVFWFKYEFKNHQYLDQVDGDVHVVVGGEDLVVPLRCSIKLQKHLRNPSNFIIIDQGSHNDLASFEAYSLFLDQALQ